MTIDIVKESRRVYQQLLNAEAKGLPATLTLDEWIETIGQFEGLCAYCHSQPFEVLEHIDPIESGCQGTTRDNCVPACYSCNTKKSWRTVMFSEGATLLEKIAAVLRSFEDAPARGKPEQETKQMPIRFPLDLHAWIAEQAEKEGRSFNMQVLWMVRDYIAIKAELAQLKQERNRKH